MQAVSHEGKAPVVQGLTQFENADERKRAGGVSEYDVAVHDTSPMGELAHLRDSETETESVPDSGCQRVRTRRWGATAPGVLRLKVRGTGGVGQPSARGHRRRGPGVQTPDGARRSGRRDGDRTGYSVRAACGANRADKDEHEPTPPRHRKSLAEPHPRVDAPPRPVTGWRPAGEGTAPALTVAGSKSGLDCWPGTILGHRGSGTTAGGRWKSVGWHVASHHRAFG
jgi:hypothetical protein